MASITLQVAQDVSDFVKTDETADVELRTAVDSYASQFSVGTHIGSGVYRFDNIVSGTYRVYDTSAGTQILSFGDIVIGEKTAVLDSGNQSIGGTKTFTAQTVHSGGATITGTLNVDTIEQKTAAAGVTIEGITFLDGVVSDVITFNVLPTSSVAPTLAGQFTNKTYVDNAISQVQVSAFQQPARHIRIIATGTEEAGKTYQSVGDAINYISSNSATESYLIELVSGQADANYSNIFLIPHSDLALEYITIRGQCKNDTIVLLGTAGDTAWLTRNNLRFENCSVYMTTTDITGARTYTSVLFDGCDLYAYNDITFNATWLKQCNIFSSTGKTVTLTGSDGGCIGSNFTNSVTETTFNGLASYVDSLDTTYTMPTAPNISA